jgi:D-alanyl-D-alanine carboxypeptidase (penicillin-binding protein 5/6)
MTSELIKHPDYYKFSKIWIENYTHPDGRVTEFVNTNKLIRFYKGCDGGKTGFTNEAMFCLSASAERNGMRVISVILGAKDSKTALEKVLSFLIPHSPNMRTN